MNNKKTIYIAGPMRGIPLYNFQEFDAARQSFALSWWNVISPADMDREAGFHPGGLPKDHDWSTIPPNFDFNAAFERDIAAIRRADAIFMLRGWEKSKGARAELAVAEWLGKEVIYQEKQKHELSNTNDSLPNREPVLRGGEHRHADATVKPTNPKDAIGTRKAKFTTLPMGAIFAAGLAMLEGACKYGRHNYRAIGVRASVYVDAAMGHIADWWEGQDIDTDSGLNHVDKGIASLLILRDAMLQGKLEDDRPPRSKVFKRDFNADAERLIDMHAGKAPKHYTIGDAQPAYVLSGHVLGKVEDAR